MNFTTQNTTAADVPRAEVGPLTPIVGVYVGVTADGGAVGAETVVFDLDAAEGLSPLVVADLLEYQAKMHRQRAAAHGITE